MRNWSDSEHGESEGEGYESSSGSGWSIDRQDVAQEIAHSSVVEPSEHASKREWSEIEAGIYPADVEREYQSEGEGDESPREEEEPFLGEFDDEQASSTESDISRTPSEIREEAIPRFVYATLKAAVSIIGFTVAVTAQGAWWCLKSTATKGGPALAQYVREARRNRNVPYLPLVGAAFM
jgi:hypothetical protein